MQTHSLSRIFRVFATLLSIFFYNFIGSNNIIRAQDIPLIPDTPIGPEEEITTPIILISGDTQTTSLTRYYDSKDASESVRELVVEDTLKVSFTLDNLSYYVGFPSITPPDIDNITLLINRYEKGTPISYGQFTWSATKQYNGKYTIDSKENEDIIILLPGSYQIKYIDGNSAEAPAYPVIPDDGLADSTDVKLRTSVLSQTCATITISMSCTDVAPGEVKRLPPEPDVSCTNYGAGVALGDFNVSGTGAATYDLAIETPKHRFTPKLAIAYNSNMLSYGLAGYSINISGISVISRTGKNRFYNNDYKGITYTDEDDYLLDGKRLIPTDSDSLNCSTYTVEGSPFTTVVKHNENWRIWFTVNDNGIIYEYGKDASSINKFADKSGTERIVEWYISKATDANSNYITYSYEQTDMVVYPIEITYGLNSSAQGGINSSISFEYDDLGANKRYFMIGNQRGCLRKCIKSITTQTKSTVYRKYLLSYDATADQVNGKITKLKSITIQNGAGENSAPINFNWNSLTEDFHASVLRSEIEFSEQNATNPTTGFLSSDINADGISDIIKMTNARGNINGTVGPVMYLHISLSKKAANGNISFDDPIKYTLPGLAYTDRDLTTDSFNPSFIDIDGDGYNDLILTYPNKPNFLFWIIWGKDIIARKTSEDGKAMIPIKASALYTVADYDGDGKDEIIYFDTNNYGDNTYQSGLIEYQYSLNTEIKYSFKLTSEPKNLFSADYNNDGLIDIILFHEKGFTIYYNNGGLENSVLFSENNKYEAVGLTNKPRMMQGDFNGDGLIDFVFYDTYAKKLCIARNNANGSFPISNTDMDKIDINENDENQSITICDFDHDGFDDVLIAVRDGGSIKTKWLYSGGVTLKQKKEYSFVAQNSMAPLANSIFIGDFDGDGSEEIASFDMILNSDSGVSSIKNFYSHKTYNKAYEERRINSISNGLGRNVSFKYASITNPSVYSATHSVYPLKSYVLPMSVVSETTVNSEEFGIERNIYKYDTFRYHITGRGSLGFKSVTKNNLTKGVKEITENCKLDPKWYVPIESKTTTIIDGDSTVTRSSNYIYLKGNNYSALPEVTETVDFDGNKSITHYSYNDDGLLENEKTFYGEGEDMYKSVSLDEYVYAGNKWVPKRITNSAKHSDDASESVVKTRISYDEQGNTVSKIEFADTDMALTTSSTYDQRGNLLSIVKTGKGITPVSKYFEYDTNSRFLEKTYSSPASAIIRYSYDNWGNIVSETDETDAQNKLIRTIEYDSWSRKVSETAPDGSKTTYTYGWGITDEYRQYTTILESNGEIVTKWFDSLGRERLTKTTGPGGLKVSEATHYDKMGQISHVESYRGNLVLDKKYSYDARGRIKTLSDAGRLVSYNYNNRKTIKYVNDRQYISIQDAWGNIVESRDPLSSVSYSYLSNGKPSEIKTDDSSITIQYDACGNRTRVYDSDTGVNTYVYSADGTLLSHTDARGVKTEYEVDFLGRITKIKTGNRIVTNTYGTEGYGMQRLIRTSDGQNHISYTYDRYGRVIKECRTVGTKGEYTYEFEYNACGQLIKTNYPGDLEVTYEYDKNGNRTKINAANNEIWSFKSNDGKTAKASVLGSFLHTRYVDDFGNLQKFELNNEQCVNRIMSVNEAIYLEIDPTTGNIMTRQDVKGKYRNYEYDDVDRLTSVISAGKEILSMQYAENGNILNKSDVGDYIYNDTRIHAVSEISNLVNTVPSATQTLHYNEIDKVDTITEGQLKMEFNYGPDGQRWFSSLSDSTGIVRETIYLGEYEKIVENGLTRELYYLEGNVIIIKQNNTFTPYAVFADERGSILSVFDKEGRNVFSSTYDEWGNQTVIKNSIGLYRGYTSHEMMPEFGIINMNGRLYDPVLARFYAPDSNIQEPENSQNFNRYSYCLNNPLRYTDPSGEWFVLDDLIVGAVGFITGYVFNGIQTGHWGMSSVKTGLCSAAMSYLGFNSIAKLSGNVSLGRYLIGMGISNVANSLIPPTAIPVTSNISISISPMLGWGEYGLTGGGCVSLAFNFGDGWNISLSGTFSNQYYGGDFSFAHKRFGLGYGFTHYNNQYIQNGNRLGAQNVGTISALIGGVSARVSNDLFGFEGKDQWRSSAVEIGYKNLTIGTYVTTNNGKEESREKKVNEGRSKKWIMGDVYSAPIWIGVKSGNHIQRFGYSFKGVQQATQNIIHRFLTKTPYFSNYGHLSKGVYIYSGYDSPCNLW